MRTVITTLSLVWAFVCSDSAPAQNWGTITRAAIRDAFINSSLANNFTVDGDGGAGVLFTQSLVDDAVKLDSFGQGPHDRGLAQGFAALSLNSRDPPILKARAILTGNISDQPPVGGVPVNDAAARGTASASEVFQYIGAVPTVLTWSFTMEGRLVDPIGDPEPNAATYIKAQVAIFPEGGYFFTTEVVNLFDSGVFPKNADLISLQILHDTAGSIATRTANLSFGVTPGEIFYLFEQLDAQAFRDARAADAFGTLTVQFDQPDLVRSLSVPEPAALTLLTLGLTVLMWQTISHNTGVTNQWEMR
jgi:hypothetical protein